MERSRKTTWKEFLSRHWELIVADFFTDWVLARAGKRCCDAEDLNSRGNC